MKIDATTVTKTLRVLSGLALAMAVLVLTQPAARAADALIGHWLSGPASLTDSSGFTPAGTHDGVAVGDNAALLAWSADVPPGGFTGQSLDLSSNSVAVLITNTATTDANYTNTFDEGIASKFTAACWFKGTLAGTWVSKSGNTPLGWKTRPLSPKADFTMRSNTGESVASAMQSANTVDGTNWHHIAAVFDGTASFRQLYVDGVLQAGTTGNPYTVTFSTMSHLLLGATQGNTADAAISTFFPGLLYDVRMYNYPLNAIQVTNIYSPAAQAASKDIFTFTFPTYGAATIAGTNISITVPFATDVTALAPTYTISGVSATPASGSPQNFTTPQTYTVTAQDSSTKDYLVTVTLAPISSSKDILTFGPGAVITGTNIAWVVPYGPVLTALAPTYTLSSLVATGAPPSGTARDFTTPQTYIVTAQDSSTKTYTVAVAVLGPPFTWTNVSGDWSNPANWTNSLGAAEAPATTGQADYVLNFPRTGTYTANNDLSDGFLLNQLNFGGTVTIDGASGLALTANGALLPQINQNSANAVTIKTPINLVAGNVTLGGTAFGAVTLSGAISGTGSLTKTSLGGLTLSGVNNTYEGGTLANAGALSLGGTANDLLGTGAVRVNSPATLNLNGNGNLTNEFTFNGVTVNNGNSFSANLNGPVTLAATTTFDLFTTGNMTIGGDVSGPGGLTKNGIGQGPLVLTGTNTYAGPTTVNAGVLLVKSLYGNDESQWTPTNITVGSGAALVVNVGGPGELTPAQAGTAFANLSTVNNNGLKAGASIGFGTGNAGATVQTVSAILADSTGLGGGAVGLRQVGTGPLELTGANTYSGPTSTDNNGTLKVSSFNSVSSPAASSSLGRPTTVANGTIQIGKYSFSGGGLIYTGAGETTDRVINMGGANGSTYRLDQSGSGLLKFTSAFTITDNRGPKTIVLQGSTAGTGEIASVIPNGDTANPNRLTKSGTGTWTLSGVNLYTGTTTVSDGNLVIGGAGQLEGGAYAADIALSATTSTLAYHSSAAQTLSGVISGPGGLTQAGPGTLTLTGVNTYTGATTVTAGELVCGDNLGNLDALGSGALSISNGATVNLNYVGTKTATLPSMTLGGVEQTGIGTYGSVGSGATFESAFFVGLGTVNLVPAPKFRWNGANGADWSVAGNWNNTVPGAGNVALFSDSGSAGATVKLDTDVTVAGLTFNNLVANQTIAPTIAETLTLDTGTAVASSIAIEGGSQTITAAIYAPQNLKVSGPASATLNLYGAITTGMGDSWDEELIIGPNVVLNGTASWTSTGARYMTIGSPTGATLTINDNATIDWSLSWDMFIAWNTGDIGKVVQNGGTVTTPAVGTAWFNNNGPGVQLGGASDPVTAEYDLNGGTLITPNVYNVHGLPLTPPTGSAIFRFNGGVLRGTQNDNLGDPSVVQEGSTNLMGNLSHAYVGLGGAKIDVATFSCGINQALEHDPALGTTPDGGLHAMSTGGPGTLALYKLSTFTGPLVIDTDVTVDLGYTGNQRVASVSIGGVDQGTGTFGVGGLNPGGVFTGTGTVTVLPTPPPTPVLPASSLSIPPGGVPTFTGIATVSGYTYYLVWKNSLTDPSWTPITPGTVSTGSPITLTDPSPSATQRFYRLEAQ